MKDCSMPYVRYGDWVEVHCKLTSALLVSYQITDDMCEKLFKRHLRYRLSNVRGFAYEDEIDIHITKGNV